MTTLGVLLGVELSLADDERTSNDTAATNTFAELNKAKEAALKNMNGTVPMEVDISENEQKVRMSCCCCYTCNIVLSV